MSYSSRKISKNAKKKLIYTILFVIFLAYASLNWVLPNLIDGLGTIKDSINPSEKKIERISDQEVLAPPILNIPYEATNTAVINIRGYAQPETTVKIYSDDSLKQEVGTGSDGSFIALEIDLVIGTNNINAKAFKDEKESLLSKTFRIIYDRDRPTLSIYEPQDGKEIQGGDKKVKVVGKTDGDAQIYVNGSRLVLESGGTFSTEININEGENTITIKAQDSASNTTEMTRKVIFTP